MPYTLPDFNLSCRIYTYVAPPGPLTVIRVVEDCNLQFSRRINSPYPGNYASVQGFSGGMWLLLPPLTDIRPPVCYGIGVPESDLVEVPAASGRYYYVAAVDDVGKGFANEFRCANLAPTAEYGNWPVPIP